MNTNSNSYTIIYASVMVIIVAFLLAFVSSSLKSTQDKNVQLDTKKQILSLIHISEPTRLGMISYAVFCLKKKKHKHTKWKN